MKLSDSEFTSEFFSIKKSGLAEHSSFVKAEDLGAIEIGASSRPLPCGVQGHPIYPSPIHIRPEL